MPGGFLAILERVREQGIGDAPAGEPTAVEPMGTMAPLSPADAARRGAAAATERATNPLEALGGLFDEGATRLAHSEAAGPVGRAAGQVAQGVLSIPGGVEQGVRRSAAAAAGAGELFGVPGAGEFRDRTFEQIDQANAERSGITGDTLGGRVGRNVASTLTEAALLLPTVGGGFLRLAQAARAAPRVARAAGAFVGAQPIAISEAAREGQDAGLEGGELARHALVQGAIEGGFSALAPGGVERLTGGALDGLRRGWVRTLREMGSEAAEESATELAQGFASYATLPQNQGRTLGDVFDEWVQSVPEIALTGALAGGVPAMVAGGGAPAAPEARPADGQPGVATPPVEATTAPAQIPDRSLTDQSAQTPQADPERSEIDQTAPVQASPPETAARPAPVMPPEVATFLAGLPPEQRPLAEETAQQQIASGETDPQAILRNAQQAAMIPPRRRGVRESRTTAAPTAETAPQDTAPPDAGRALVEAITDPAPSQQADDGGEVRRFAADSGTLGVPRAEMPQVSSDQRGALANFVRARGIEFERTEIPAQDLRPTQSEYLPAKVAKALERRGEGQEQRAILVSSDGHVIDGHHQWLAALEQAPDEPMKIIRLGATAREALAAVQEFPSSETESGATPDSATASQEQEAPRAAAQETRAPTDQESQQAAEDAAATTAETADQGPDQQDEPTPEPATGSGPQTQRPAEPDAQESAEVRTPAQESAPEEEPAAEQDEVSEDPDDGRQRRSAGEVSPEGQTSARRVDINRDRALLGLDDLPSESRQSWEQALKEAKDQGGPEDARRLAEAVVQQPRALSATETAGLVLRAAQLKKDHRAAVDLLAEAVGTRPPEEVNGLQRDMEQIELEFDTISIALRLSGTEKGRALAAQKLTINQDYDLVSILNRAKAAKGKPLSDDQRQQLEDLVQRAETAEARIAELQKQLDEARVNTAVKRRATRRRAQSRPRKELAKERADLLAQAQELLRNGCKHG